MGPARVWADRTPRLDLPTTMNLTLEQIAGMAPDPAAAAAGKSLAAAKHWLEVGRNDVALWGKCQGSSVYQVKVDLVQIAFNCTCPSRKIPCKHVLGVLTLAAQSPAHVAPGEPPQWVVDWLQKRRDREEKRTECKEKEDGPAPASDNQKARERRTEQRNKNVQDGLDRLDLWLKDLVRSGLADLAGKPASFWEEQAKRLVDAQRPASPAGWLAWPCCRPRRPMQSSACSANWGGSSCCSTHMAGSIRSNRRWRAKSARSWAGMYPRTRWNEKVSGCRTTGSWPASGMMTASGSPPDARGSSAGAPAGSRLSSCSAWGASPMANRWSRAPSRKGRSCSIPVHRSSGRSLSLATVFRRLR